MPKTVPKGLGSAEFLPFGLARCRVELMDESGAFWSWLACLLGYEARLCQPLASGESRGDKRLNQLTKIKDQEPNPLKDGACMSNARSTGELSYCILRLIPIRELALHH